MSEEINGSTIIKKCNCNSDFQDKAYGKSLRLHNVGGAKGSKKYKCTVCGNIK